MDGEAEDSVQDQAMGGLIEEAKLGGRERQQEVWLYVILALPSL
jgi:hypothetical protein